MVISLKRNLVVQTEDHVQVFSAELVSKGDGSRDGIRTSHIHPLGKKYIICLQPDRSLIILEVKTLRKPDPASLKSLRANQFASARASSDPGVVAEFGVPVVLQALSSRTPLPIWPEASEDNALLGGLSPSRTRIVTVYNLRRRELWIKAVEDGTILAKLHLEDRGLEAGVIYDLTFDSETRFHLKIDGPRHHIQVPYDVIALPLGPYSHTIKRGKPVPVSKPRKIPPYTLDSSLEWVLDARRRKICWIPPEYVRRGSGGHFWADLSLVMLGSDAIVRTLTFKEPDS